MPANPISPSARFAVRGVVEGFYGTFYTAPERNLLIRFLGANGFNLYVYGPKNDHAHREKWRAPYLPVALAQFQETVAVAREAGVTFCYSLSPGPSICYSSLEEQAIIQEKWRVFYDLGVRAFSLLLDDITPSFQHKADGQRYPTYAAAHADLCNQLYVWLQQLDPACTMSMCPTYYAGVRPFNPYVAELGEQLHPAVDIFYTGPDICTPIISEEQVAAFAAEARRPPLLWDNYPVNDLGMRHQLHLGPLRGRDPGLAAVSRGIVANLMLQPEASKIPLHTLATFFADPAGYRPETAWEQALLEVAGPDSYEALRLFAGYSLASCLGRPSRPPLDQLVAAALAALQAGERPGASAAVAGLLHYLQLLDQANYWLRYYQENLRLRQDLLPWLELFDTWQALGQNCLRALLAWDRGEPYDWFLRRATELVPEIERSPKSVDMGSLKPLADYTLEKFAQTP